MTPEQKSTLIFLIRRYGEAEVTWSKEYHNYMSSDKRRDKLPTSQPVTEAFKKILDFVQSI